MTNAQHRKIEIDILLQEWRRNRKILTAIISFIIGISIGLIASLTFFGSLNSFVISIDAIIIALAFGSISLASAWIPTQWNYIVGQYIEDRFNNLEEGVDLILRKVDPEYNKRVEESDKSNKDEKEDKH